jgi:hypothetical protein
MIYVELYNGAWQKIGSGPLQNVLEISLTEALDEAGALQFSVPATDYRAATLVQQAAFCRVVLADGTAVLGSIGKDTIDATGDPPTRTVEGLDLFGELGRYSMGWWCFYDTSDIASVVLPEILAPAGWSAGTLDSGLGTFYGRFDGDSCLSALIKLISQLPGKHFRMGSTVRTLDLGAFGTLNAVRFTNVPHLLANQDGNAQIAIIGSLQITADRGPIVNRIIPFGAGADDGNINRAKVKLFHLTRSDTTRWANIQLRPGIRGSQATVSAVGADDHQYIVDSTDGFMPWPIQQLLWCMDPDDLTQPLAFDFVVNTITSGPPSVNVRGSPTLPAQPPSFPAYLIGNPQLYLEDADAFAADPHEAVIIFNDITLTDLTNGSWAQGALQLYNRALRYLQQHSVAQTCYTLSVLRCPASVRAGDKVQVIYRGNVLRDGQLYQWIDLDEELFIVRITRTFEADGTTSAAVEVSNLDRLPLNDAGLLTDQAVQLFSMNRAAR